MSHRYRNRYNDAQSWPPSCPGPLREEISRLIHRGPTEAEARVEKTEREARRKGQVERTFVDGDTTRPATHMDQPDFERALGADL